MVECCSDDMLGYERSRTRFRPGEGLAMDETYRLAHLPLVAPHHPKVIPRKAGAFYDMGRHPYVYSVVAPVPANLLAQSEAFQQLVGALKTAPFASKVAWDIVKRRALMLHATVCGGYGESADISEQARGACAKIGRFSIELRGLFSGNVNRGRLYLCAYPELQDGANMFHVVQGAFGKPLTDLYVVGFWNLTDDLTPDEASALSTLIETWWARPLLRYELTELWLLRSADDLVLDAEVAERFTLA